MTSIRKVLYSCSFLLAATLCSPAYAQLNNKPFSFNTPSGGVGMSVGGQQAILNEKIYNATPDNMVRGPGGNLFTVTKVDGGSAVVSYNNGNFIPSYRGASFRGDNVSWSSGAFNDFFVQNSGNISYAIAFQPQMHTGEHLNTWTSRVVNPVILSSAPANSVSTWTGMVIQSAY